MTNVLRGVALGAIAGAAGTTTLNAVTYLDMAVRGRPTSRAPEDTVEKLADKAGASIPGDEDSRANRVAGLGPLTGLGAGIGVGVLLGLARSIGFRPAPVVGGLIASIGAMVGSDGPMTALGITDPRTWAAKDWISDIVPHAAYGAVTATALQALMP